MSEDLLRVTPPSNLVTEQNLLGGVLIQSELFPVSLRWLMAKITISKSTGEYSLLCTGFMPREPRLTGGRFPMRCE